MWYSSKDNERLNKIMVSACQQAKQFVLPTIQEPITVEQLCGNLQQANTKTILFEPDGKPLMQALTAIQTDPKTTEYGLILGPEGGFTDEERQQLDQAGAACYALTPTILRSIEAATVALGVLRSVGR
jgi:16S rRNA (uracil1498-N3)-methyltransferase